MDGRGGAEHPDTRIRQEYRPTDIEEGLANNECKAAPSLVGREGNSKSADLTHLG